MTYDIIKTDKYLLILGDTFIWEGNEPYFVAEKLVDGRYDVFQIDNVNDWDTSNQFKILAHLPLSADNLKNIPLLPPLQNDNTEGLISEHCNKNIANLLIKGYNKAKDKYKYTDEDLRKIFSRGWELRERYNGSDRNGYEENYPSNWKDMDYEERQDWFYEQEIKSLTKYPIGFELGNEVDNKTYTSITRRHDGLTLWIGKYIY